VKEGKVASIGLNEIEIEWDNGQAEFLDMPEPLLQKIARGERILLIDPDELYGEHGMPENEIPIPEETEPVNGTNITDEVSRAIFKLAEKQGKADSEWFKKHFGMELNERDQFYSGLSTIMSDIENSIKSMDADQDLARYADVPTGNVL
jgi:hypothetical protein